MIWTQSSGPLCLWQCLDNYLIHDWCEILTSISFVRIPWIWKGCLLFLMFPVPNDMSVWLKQSKHSLNSFRVKYSAARWYLICPLSALFWPQIWALSNLLCKNIPCQGSHGIYAREIKINHFLQISNCYCNLWLLSCHHQTAK